MLNIYLVMYITPNSDAVEMYFRFSYTLTVSWSTHSFCSRSVPCINSRTGIQISTSMHIKAFFNIVLWPPSPP